MKRFALLALVVTLTITTTGCRRGIRSWWCRGARCAPTPTASPAPYYYAPQYAPSYCPPPANCAPSTSYSVPTYSEGAAGCDPGYSSYDGGVGFETTPIDPSGAQLPPADVPPIINGASVPSGPLYSRVISDRKLEPGERLTTPVSLPVTSARKHVAETKE